MLGDSLADYFEKVRVNYRHGARPHLSMQPKSLERVVDQASQGLICDTASFRAISEHVRHR